MSLETRGGKVRDEGRSGDFYSTNEAGSRIGRPHPRDDGIACIMPDLFARELVHGGVGNDLDDSLCKGKENQDMRLVGLKVQAGRDEMLPR